MPPRPILKSLPEPDISFTSGSPFPFSSSAGLLDSPHVHFPPTPTLTSTGMTHSPFMYDRAPIVVDQNTCALPERGERSYLQLQQAPNTATPAELFGQLAKLQLRNDRDRSSEELDKGTGVGAGVGVGDYFNYPPATPLPRGMRTTASTTRLMTAPPSPTSSSRRSVCYGPGYSYTPAVSTFPRTPGFGTPTTTNPSSPLGLHPDVRGPTTPTDAEEGPQEDDDARVEQPQASLQVPVVGPVPASAVRQVRLQPTLNQRPSTSAYHSPPPPPSLARSGSTSTSSLSSTSSTSSMTTPDSDTGPSFFNTASSSSATLPNHKASSISISASSNDRDGHGVAKRGKHHSSRSRSGERCALLRTTNTNTNTKNPLTATTITPTSTTSYDATVDDCLEGF